MGDRTGIEWTDATWNPVRGCSRVSEGCRNCYAEAVAARFSGPGQPYEGLARRRSNGEPQWTGEVRVIEEHLEDPLRWRRPRRIFVNSMSDLFHEKLYDEDIGQIFGVMCEAKHHTFQVLTKRPARMREFMTKYTSPGGPLPPLSQMSHVWLGTSVENQEAADERIPELLATPAAVRFLSCEPLLGDIDLTGWLWGPAQPCAVCPRDADCECGYLLRGDLHWVIVGGESGKGARPCDVEWIRSIVEQCRSAHIPAFVKQLGAEPYDGGTYPFDGLERIRNPKGGDPVEWPEDLRVREFPNAPSSPRPAALTAVTSGSSEPLIRTSPAGGAP